MTQLLDIYNLRTFIAYFIELYYLENTEKSK